MRFDSVLAKALLSSAALMGSARADEIDDALGDVPSPAAEAVSSSTSTTKAIHHPTFTPSAIKAPFFEQFTDDWDTRWTPSHAKKANDQTGDEEWSYVGEWAVEEPTTYKGLEGDKGLVVKNAAAHHAISAKFAKKIDTTGKPLVVQYEVKTQNGLECGGAYLKLLRENKALHAEEFSNDTPYVIMFGPDKCGATNKVHFIFKHKNPKTGEYEEKHLTGPPVARVNKVSHLYTLVVQPDNSFYISIDGDRVKNGTLHDDFTPSVNPEKEIDDADDKKPETWVDDAKVPDPEAAKPEDWDEDAPYEVVDDEAEKPKDWLENEPKTIPDPEAQKPEDWDDEEDGDWIAPTIPNPKCDEVSGCGPWERPMKPNPAYKGKWTAPWIDNPLYKGVWAPRKIANPAYFNDEHPANFEPIGAVGFEIWTMQNDILFDNIYIGHSVEDAEKLKKETYDIKIVPEKEGETADFPHPQPDKKKPGSPLDIKFTEDPIAYVTEKGQLFLELLQKDPVEAVKFMPEFAGGAAAALVTVLAVLYGLIGVLFGSASAAAPKVKETAKKAADKASAVAADAKEKVVEATGTEKPAATRRSTRTT